MVEAGRVGGDQVHTAEIAQDALTVTGAAAGQALTKGLLKTEVLMGLTIGGADLDFAEVHGESMSPERIGQ